MLKQIIKYLFLVITIHLSLFSCVKEVDFKQADDFEISPVIESSLIFFEAPANSFLLNGSELTTISDFVLADFFKNQFIVDNLIKAEFIFETTNSINRGFQVQVNFIDDVEQLLHTFTFSTLPSTDHSDLLSNHEEIFEGDTLTALKNTSKLVFTLSVLPGEPINQTTPGRIKLRSKAVFYFNIGDSI